jgi:hypothetical protein
MASGDTKEVNKAAYPKTGNIPDIRKKKSVTSEMDPPK